MKKNSYTPINPKKYSCYGQKKIHTRNLIMKKIPAARKFPTPTITFLMVRPLDNGIILLQGNPTHGRQNYLKPN